MSDLACLVDEIGRMDLEGLRTEWRRRYGAHSDRKSVV